MGLFMTCPGLLPLLPALAFCLGSIGGFPVSLVPRGIALWAKNGAKEAGRGDPLLANLAPVVFAGKKARVLNGEGLVGVNGLELGGGRGRDFPVVSAVSVLGLGGHCTYLSRISAWGFGDSR